MKKLFILSFFITSTFVYAHEHWIELENFQPQIGQNIKIFVKSGHNFPKGEFVVSEKLLKKIKVCLVNKNEVKEYVLNTEKDSKFANVVFDSTGTYVISFVIAKPPKDEPVYFGKSIVSIGAEVNEIKRDGNSLLEILPGKGNLELNEKVKFKVFYNGNPVKTTINISIDGKKNFFLQTNKDGEFSLELKNHGKYLLTTSYGKYGCSLTFFVK